MGDGETGSYYSLFPFPFPFSPFPLKPKYMFPIDDDNPTRITPYVTYGLIALNLLIFIYELTFSAQGLTPFVTNIPAYFYLGIWFVQQALYSFATLAPRTNVGMESGGVAYWAHAGGFIFGALLAPLLGLFSQRSEAWNYTFHGHKLSLDIGYGGIIDRDVTFSNNLQELLTRKIVDQFVKMVSDLMGEN